MSGEHDRDRRSRGATRGHEAHRQHVAYGLTAEEEDNVLTVSTWSPDRYTDLVIQVPVNTSLKLNVINGGDIMVENVTGEIEVNNTNGGVQLTNVSGSVIAHALNKT